MSITNDSGSKVDEPRAQILILDRHLMLGQTLLSALGSGSDRLALCGPVSDIYRGVRICGDREPDLVILGLHGGDQLERLTSMRELGDAFPELAVVVISDGDDESEAVDMLEAGATGFIASTRPLSDLVALIERVLAGKPMIVPEDFPSLLRTASRRRRRAEETRRRIATLTPREREVLQLMSTGLTDDEIAERLFISQRTVETHVHSLMRKLGTESRLKAVVLILQPTESTEGQSAAS